MAISNEPLGHTILPSHEAPHVVLSQMGILSPSGVPSPSVVNAMHAIKGTNVSLHNAVVHQQHQVQHEYENNKRPLERPPFLERKKSRRHTVSNGSTLNIDTKNLLLSASSPRSAAIVPFTRSEERQAFIDQQKKSLGPIDIPPPPTLQELGMGWTNEKDYDGLSRAQLISRLIELETQKKACLEKKTTSESPSVSSQEAKAPTEEDRSAEEEEEEEEEESEDHSKSEKMQCKWKDCGLFFDGLQKLIAHINSEHVKSGKPCYSCEWENCSRNEKPFTKRHKMYNHLRTHTGERPFVCVEEGCGKRFSRPDSLTTHVKTHSNVRPYKCSFKSCNKAYYHARSLKKHEKSHEAVSMLSTPNSSIQFSHASGTPYGHTDYIGSQSQSLPTSPHYSLQSPAQHKPYTPTNNVLYSPAGMVEQQQNNEHLIAQPHQLMDSANHQQGFGYEEP
ncbi:hypothetical protein BY458DRAFT_495977 [Sporodiniella umbellata]|nr:hypothetical protein BY458DRAFT_495977 [Sporodiniella umbellata]